MKHIIAAVLALTLVTPAFAQHHGHGRYSHHQSYRGGNFWGPVLLGGALVAGSAYLYNQSRPEPQVVYAATPPQPQCQSAPLYDAYGRYVTTQEICR